MAYVDPKLRPRLESLSPELRAAILARNVPLHTLRDLIGGRCCSKAAGMKGRFCWQCGTEEKS